MSLFGSLDPDADVIFDYGPALPHHANGMVISAHDALGELHMTETYYSVGGGFVVTAREFEQGAAGEPPPPPPHPYANMAELLARGRETGLSIARMARAMPKSTPIDVLMAVQRELTTASRATST